MVTNGGGTATWAGGLEPFGAPWTAGLDRPDPEPVSSGGGRFRLATAALERLSMEKVFVRYPGQGSSDAFRVGAAQGDVYYNLHRWYQTGTARYERPDPIGPSTSLLIYRDSANGLVASKSGISYYEYAGANPSGFNDPFGLHAFHYLWIPVVRACYEDLHQRRVGGHARFPGPQNDFMRHCTVSCESAKGVCGPGLARAAGVGNEVQGIVIDIRNRQTGAFQPQDFAFNEQGFSCAQSSGGQCSCEDCCRQSDPLAPVRRVVPLLIVP